MQKAKGAIYPWIGTYFVVVCSVTFIFSVLNGPFARYVQLRVGHAPGMPWTFSPQRRVSDPDMQHGTCATPYVLKHPETIQITDLPISFNIDALYVCHGASDVILVNFLSCRVNVNLVNTQHNDVTNREPSAHFNGCTVVFRSHYCLLRPRWRGSGFRNTSRIHVIFTHHINQFHKVCRVFSILKIVKLNFAECFYSMSEHIIIELNVDVKLYKNLCW